jgi:carbon monoxide dehydrogenase subunit G
MDLNGQHSIPLAREAVWTALNDPDVLRACIPGCKTLTRTSDTEFSARVVSRIGPVSASFAGSVVLSDIDPARACTITGSGEGGVAGFAKGSSRIVLADQPDGGTVLTYNAKAEIGGKLASLGSRLLEGAARKTADEFFSAFVTRLVAGEPVEAEVAPRPAAETAGAAPAVLHSAPARIKVEVGEVRVVVQTPWMVFVAVAGWFAAAGLGWRLFNRND